MNYEAPINKIIFYLTYLQENLMPVAHRSDSVEVFDEEDENAIS